MNLLGIHLGEAAILAAVVKNLHPHFSNLGFLLMRVPAGA